MFLLILFAFIAGFVTILSPCILPLLPIILSGSTTGGKSKPIGVVTGFVASFTFFTLFLSTIVQATGISPDTVRLVSIFLLIIFGLSLITPKVQASIEQLFTRLAGFTPKTTNKTGFLGGILIGISLGLIWTPCVGPILASVISLALTGSVSSSAFFITFAYSLGTAIPMLAITYGGRQLLQKVPWLLANTSKIQQGFGLVMIITAIGIYYNVDRKFQTWVLETFPQYGVGLTAFEDNQTIQQQLSKLQSNTKDSIDSIVDSTRAQAPEIIAGGDWFNSEPLSLSQLKGKVILVDFWTYSCINCIRTLPYLRDWHQKYADKGLVIIGVHSPEFEFEKKASNVAQAIEDFDLQYPIVQDNNFSTWKSYQNKYWPAKYLIDRNGKIRYTHFGEGKYQETEQIIQQLIQETGANLNEIVVSEQSYQTFSKTPELYLGSDRQEFLASPQSIKVGELHTYSLPRSNLPENHFAFQGGWIITSEYAAPQSNSNLVLNFEAKQVFLVMNPEEGTISQVKVYLDDQLVSQPTSNVQPGADVTKGTVSVDTDRLYHLIDLTQPGRHTLRLEFLDSNTMAFAFTFG